MTRISVVLPAAGASSRMRGRDKLLEPVGGAPLLRVMAERALQVSDSVLVTLPPNRPDRVRALDGLPVTQVTVEDADTGMSASLRAVNSHVPHQSSVMVLPPDMPEISAVDLQTVVTAFDRAQHTQIIQATAEDGTPGHPVVFPADLAAAFADLTGDSGARSIVKANQARLSRVALPARHATTDLDTPEAWADWRARNPGL